MFKRSLRYQNLYTQSVLDQWFETKNHSTNNFSEGIVPKNAKKMWFSNFDFFRNCVRRYFHFMKLALSNVRVTRLQKAMEVIVKLIKVT